MASRSDGRLSASSSPRPRNQTDVALPVRRACLDLSRSESLSLPGAELIPYDQPSFVDGCATQGKCFPAVTWTLLLGALVIRHQIGGLNSHDMPLQPLDLHLLPVGHAPGPLAGFCFSRAPNCSSSTERAGNKILTFLDGWSLTVSTRPQGPPQNGSRIPS